nr:hypothetical protein BaRGS_001683 [Batillaria attramentaria]
MGWLFGVDRSSQRISLDNLQAVYADNYKLCCPVMLPVGFNTKNCLAPFDEISSCDALLRADIYRVALSVFAILALAGNVGSIVFRTVVRKDANKSGFGVFVTHLAASDCLMGVYLSIIGVADRLYLGTYVWEDAAWKRSTACQVAGFLSLVSSEVSALIICLITLERFLVLSFPFSRVHFYPRSAHFACFAVWALGVLLAALPLLPVTSHWEFYSQTGICIPLPITKTSFHGHDFAFGVMIVFNFVLFLLIAVGQASIYFSVRANSMAAATATAATSKKSQDTTVARRLITIAVTDFLCWFPVGFLGLLASRGTPIPGEVNVTIAIAVLPLNAAINPFLYTLNLILERRRKNAEEKLLKAITDELSSGGAVFFRIKVMHEEE